MPNYDFQGADFSNPAGQFNSNNVAHTSTTFTEGGINFSFTSNGPVNLDVGISAIEMDGDGFTPGAPLIGTVANVDTDFGQTFFTGVAVQLGSHGTAGVGGFVQIRVRFGNTANMTTTAVTYTTITGFSPSHLIQAPDQNAEYNRIFIEVSNGYAYVNHITGTPNCFAAGTMIATDQGEVAVEDLKAGDLVRTADGRLTPVTWLGTQQIDTRLTHPAKVNPICITAGALGGGLPLRDLHVSADHAIEIDGTLYNAGVLVNGETIYQKRQMPKEGFTYYHVETEAHELLLAEGVAAESFIDYAGRDSFDNAADAGERVIPEMALPRVSAARLVPAALKVRLAPAAAAA